MEIIYVTHPQAGEDVLPKKIVYNKKLILTNSGVVVDECIKKKINYKTLGEYINYNKIKKINNKIIFQQRKFLDGVSKKLKDKFYYSEILRDYLYSYLIEYEKINSAFSNIFNNIKINKISFVYGNNLFNSPGAFEKGEYLTYAYLVTLKKKNNFYFKLISREQSYCYLSGGHKINSTFLNTNYRKKILNKKKISNLFIFTYEQCLLDLYPCMANNIKLKKNFITCKNSDYISGNYDLDFQKVKTKIKNFDELNRIYNILKKEIKNFYKINFKNIKFSLHDTFCRILLFQIKKKIYDFEKIKIKLISTFNTFNISKIYLAGVSHNYPIAAYLYSEKKKVIIRQHGAYSYAHEPNISLVKNCTFLTHSKFLQKYIKPWGRNEVHYISRFRDKIYVNQKKKNILIAHADSEDPVNARFYLDFYINFFNKSYKNFNFKFRDHPRWKGNSFMRFENLKNISEDKETDIIKTLSSCSLTIINFDYLNSVILDSINCNVPVIIVSPAGRFKNKLSEDNLYNFPNIASTVEELTNFIEKIQIKGLNSVIISAQQKWCNKVFGKADSIDSKILSFSSHNFFKRKSANNIIFNFFKKKIKRLYIYLLLKFIILKI
jgi:hypothetical protein